MTYTNAACLGKKWLELQFRTLDVGIVAVTGAYLRLREGDNELMARDYSFFRWDRRDGTLGDGTDTSGCEVRRTGGSQTDGQIGHEKRSVEQPKDGRVESDRA